MKNINTRRLRYVCMSSAVFVQAAVILIVLAFQFHILHLACGITADGDICYAFSRSRHFNRQPTAQLFFNINFIKAVIPADLICESHSIIIY